MLRHVISHLCHQDWTAVVIELIVVVADVFIGVQASNWNGQRETDQKSAIYTAHLKNDLRMEAWSYDMQISYNQQVLANARRAADALDGRAPLADEALLIAAYRATQFNGGNRRRATYDELTSTGEIGLIRDPALRTLAMDVYTQPQLEQLGREGKESEYRRAFRMVLPWQVQQALQDKCGDHVIFPGNYAGIATVLDYPCKLDLPASNIASGAAVLRKDPRITALLQLRIADLATAVANLTTYFGFIREPLQRLAKERQ